MAKVIAEAFDQFGNYIGTFEFETDFSQWKGWYGSNEVTTMDLSDVPKGVTIPIVNVTQAIDTVDGQIYTVRDIIRYNPPPVGRFACHLTRNSDGEKALANVWFDVTWKCNEYIPTRYRDEDGVNKGL